MRNTFFALALFSLLGVLACNSSRQQPSVVDSSMVCVDGIQSLDDLSGMDVVAICDHDGFHPVDLFRGSFNDSLLTALAGGDGFKSSINVFLLRDFGHTALVDAGLGLAQGGALLAKLMYLGVKPEQVDAIFLTHLHPDHIGGLLKDGLPVFPNAAIYLSVDEFDAWSDGGPMAAQNDLWKEVLSNYANNIQLFTDGDTLMDGFLVAHLAPGHTPGHTVFQSGRCLFVGDLLHAQDLQLSHPDFCARYDNDPALAVATRKQWLASLGEDMFLLGAHCYTPFIQKSDF